MPDIHALIQSQFEERRGVHGEVLVWIIARHRSTGLPEALGIWSGNDHRDFEVEGETRTYYGLGRNIDPGLIRSVVGLNTVYHTITLPPFSDEVMLALQQYDARLGRLQLHSIAFDIDTGAQLAEPIRLIKGTIQEEPKTIGQKGSRSAKTELKVASSARNLSLGVALFKSDAAQREVDPNDRGREYVAVTADWPVPWGES